MVHNIKVLEKITHEIDLLNDALPSYKRMRHIALDHEEWSPETGELTPSLKLSREFIRKKFEKQN